MLQHLADVVENGPRAAPGSTYKEEAMDALIHGAELARDRRMNLMYVARVYDDKVARPVPTVEGRREAVRGSD